MGHDHGQACLCVADHRPRYDELNRHHIVPLYAGGPDVVLEDDGWSITTADGSLSAHFEHTVAITGDGPLILTASERLAEGRSARSVLR